MGASMCSVQPAGPAGTCCAPPQKAGVTVAEYGPEAVDAGGELPLFPGAAGAALAETVVRPPPSWAGAAPWGLEEDAAVLASPAVAAQGHRKGEQSRPSPETFSVGAPPRGQPPWHSRPTLLQSGSSLGSAADQARDEKPRSGAGSPAESSGCGEKPRAGRCALPALGVSALCLAVFGLSIAALSTFSPVYSPISCYSGDQSFTPPVINESGIFVRASKVMICSNPNPYHLRITEGKPGQLLVLPNMTVLGTVTVEPFSMAAQGTGEMVAKMSMKMAMDEAVALAAQPDLKVLLELHMMGAATVGVFSTPAFTEEALCGFAMQINGEMKYGPPMCAPSRAELRGRIPSIDSDASAPFQFGLSQEKLDHWQRLLDVACIVAIALSAALAVALCLPACAMVRRWRRGKGTPTPTGPRSDSVRDIEAQGR